MDACMPESATKQPSWQTSYYPRHVTADTEFSLFVASGLCYSLYPTLKGLSTVTAPCMMDIVKGFPKVNMDLPPPGI